VDLNHHIAHFGNPAFVKLKPIKTANIRINDANQIMYL